MKPKSKLDRRDQMTPHVSNHRTKAIITKNDSRGINLSFSLHRCLVCSLFFGIMHCCGALIVSPQVRVITIRSRISPWVYQPSSIGRTASLKVPRSSLLRLNDKERQDQDISKEKKERPIADDTEAISLPSYASILRFVGTTVIIWLSEPLLSLVDTIFVGQFGTTAQLAALGPATMLCDSAIYLLYFLAISTTNRLATAMAQHRPQEYIRKIISQSLGIATLFGLCTSMSVALFGKTLLRRIIVQDTAVTASTLDVLSYAHSYTIIRSLASTFSVVGMVAQAICLASLDLRTPAIAVAVASACNLLGDYVFTIKWGSNGAAAATALATIASTTVLLSANYRRLSNNTNTEATQFLSLPDKKSFFQLFQLAGPIFFLMCGKIVCYNAMTLRANALGVAPMAAHAILLRIFFFFGTFADSISQAAQTFFPAILYGTSNSHKPISKQNGNSVSEISDNIRPNNAPNTVIIQTTPALDPEISLSKAKETCTSVITAAEDRDDCTSVITATEDRDDSPVLATADLVNRKGEELVTSSSTFTTLSTADKILETTSLTERPKTKTGEVSLTRNKAFRILLRRLLVVSSVISTINTLFSIGLVRRMGMVFTTDLQISNCMRSQSVWLGLSLFLHSFVLSLEGALIAKRDVAFLARSYLIFLPLLIIRLHYFCPTFPGVWQTLFAFQLARLFQFAMRMLMTKR